MTDSWVSVSAIVTVSAIVSVGSVSLISPLCVVQAGRNVKLANRIVARIMCFDIIYRILLWVFIGTFVLVTYCSFSLLYIL